MPDLNDPSVISELSALHDRYESALVANDVAALTAFFWDSPHTVRYGVNEQLYGSASLAAYRQASAPVFTDRKLLRRSILALGNDTASIMCELSQKVFGQPKLNRQSQVWVRFPELGWKIVSAHVSNALTAPESTASWDAYVDQTSAALGLRLDPAHRPGVIMSLQRTSGIAAPLLAFPLPEGTEFAPVFTA